MEGPLERLAGAARTVGFPADAERMARLGAYLEAVLAAGRDVNLTAAGTLEEAVDVLALTALAVVRAWPEGRPDPRLVVDLGSGNGFPGVAAAIAWPAARVLLVERRGKKARAIGACCEAAGVANADAVACDGRELLRERPRVRGAADLVTARAVGTLEDVLRVAAPWLARGGRIAQWKGANLSEAEARAGADAARAVGLRPLPELVFPVPPGPARLLLCERPAGRGRDPR